MNISSVVVRTKPEHIQEVIEALENSGMCDVYFHDDNKVIVVIEAESTDEEVFKMKAIRSLPHVLSAELIFSYSDEWAKAKEYLDINKERVPEILNDDKVRAEDIVYKGRPPKGI
ncbi:chaperone NapD [Aquifex sp.]